MTEWPVLLTIRHLYAWTLRQQKLCAGPKCEYRKKGELRCRDCLVKTLDQQKRNTLCGVVYQNAMSEFNDIQVGLSKRIGDITCLEFIGMVVIHDEMNKWREEQAEASTSRAKQGRK